MTMLDLPARHLRATAFLACSTCGGGMTARPDAFRCDRCGTAYPVDTDGIIHAGAAPAADDTLAVRMGRWKWVAALYDLVWRPRALSLMSGAPLPPSREAEIVANAIGLRPGSVVLDNACANGFMSRLLARRPEADDPRTLFVGVDASLPMLRMARRLAVRAGVSDRVVLVHARSERLPFGPATFDGAVCGGSLNEFVRPDAVLRELARVLRPGTGLISLMFQVRGDGLRGRVQHRLAAALGIRIEESAHTETRIRKHLQIRAKFRAGMVAFVQAFAPPASPRNASRARHRARSA